MVHVSKKIKKRLLIVLVSFTILFFFLAIRLFWLQVVDGRRYDTMVDQQIFKSRIISPERGMIQDRNYQELAINVPVETVYMNPDIIKKSSMGIDQIADHVSDILNIDKNSLLDKMNKPDQYEVIARKIERIPADTLKKWIKENKIDGIYFAQEVKRTYPNKNLAAQVIGFTGIDNQGLAGIELSMEKYLLGQPGLENEYVDASGQNLPQGKNSHIDAQDGLNVVLTIDGDLQSYTEGVLQKAIDDNKVVNGGVAIVMDPRNGQILAMVSKPDFDLNKPFDIPAGGSLNNKNGETMIKELEKKFWTNKAVSYTYEPGSTFKSITASAALEEGKITPQSEVVDVPVKVSGWTINSMMPGGHGKETFEKSVYNSDNPVFVKLAISLGIDKFYSYVKAFGFNKKTGIGLPGETNSIFQPKPAEIDMATASFGQSFQITPIQMITAYTAIENGGELLKPQIVKELTDSRGNVVKTFSSQTVRSTISRKTSDTLKGILEGVVSQGTGKEAFIEGYKIAGKTGTSETFENGKRSKDKYVASFMGFAPADNPRISVLVLLDHPSGDSHYGGKIAAPVAAQIIKYALDNLKLD